MKRLGSIAAMLFGGALLLAASGVAALAEKRVALIIGNSSYQNAGRLPNPAKDADAVADMFRKSGYEVSLLKDVGNLDFKRGIRRFEDAASEADIAVVFYAGHGIEIGGTNYVIPVDAKLASDRDATDEAIELTRIIQSVDGAKRLRLVILDACRDNPFLATMKRQRQALRQVASGLGPVGDVGSETLVAYAAKQGSTAEDGRGDHSPFTTAILNNLTEPGLDIRLAFGRVRDEVLKITGNRQEPYVYGSLGGSNVALVPAPERPQLVDQDKMRADYELVMKVYEKVGSKTPLKVFLEQYPAGLYSELVRAQLAAFEANEKVAVANVPAENPRGTVATQGGKVQLAAVPQQQTPPPAQPSPDNQAWEDVKDTTDPELLRKFMQRFRDSPKYLEAQHRLEVLLRVQREREEAARTAAAEERRQKTEAELKQAWEAVQNTEDQTRLREFIRRYPASQYASEAKLRIDALVRAAQEHEDAARAAAAEERRQKAEAELRQAWEAVQGTDDQTRLRDFIRRYPASTYTAEAKQRLEVVVRAAQEREEAARAAAAEERRQKAEAEMNRAFDTLQATNDQAVVRDFLKRYPDSPYGAAAKQRLDTLVAAEVERKEQERRAAAEARRQKMEADAAAAWDGLKNTTDAVEIQKFIKRFPESSLALKDATERLGALDREAKERIARAQAEAAAARSAWESIKDTSDPAVVQGFIRQHPNTPTALVDAKQLLEVLDRRAKEREARARMEAEAAQAWSRIQNTTDQAELRGFIKRYPESPLALTDAASRLAGLEREAAERAEKARAEAAAAKAAWDLVKGTSDPAELRDFIVRYPDSPFAVRDAKLRIELIERQAKEREAKARAEAAAREAKERAEVAAREAREKAEATARDAREKAEVEMTQAWNSTKDSIEASDFRNFIKRFPNSPYVADAKQALAAFEPKPEPKRDTTPAPELRTRPAVAARPEIRTAPEIRTRPEIHIERPHETPPPKVAVRHHEDAVEAPRQQQRPVHVERPAPQHAERAPRAAPRYEARGGGGGGGGGGHAGTMSGVGF